ncbi:MAG: response regulator [Acidobacteriota bacterium]
MSISPVKSILMVGDNPVVRRLLANVEAPAPPEIEKADGISECLKRVEARRYDLIVTDVETSGADDVELLRQGHRIRPNAKVVVMSAESSPQEVIEAIRERAFSYFTRPFDPGAFVSMVAKALGLSAWRDGIEVLSARPHWIALRVQCRRETAERLIQFMRELKMDLPADERENVAAAFREMLMNALEHGAGFDPNQTIDICYVRTSRMIVYQIRDPGEGFSFDCIPHAAVSNPPDAPFGHLSCREERGIRPGGFGIWLETLSMSCFTTKKATKCF